MSSSGMNNIMPRFSYSALAVAALLVQACTTLDSGNNRRAVTQPAEGMRAYVDPATGKLGVPPPGVAAERAPAVDAAVSTSSRGLAEIQSTVPGGGVGIDLEGRFMSETTAIIDADGKVKVRCISVVPQVSEPRP